MIRSLATLAFDCRRQAFFQAQLLDALRILDRGDMPPSAMRGAWAGELGQTQFMASSYVKFAVDFDGDGRRQLSARLWLAARRVVGAGDGELRGHPAVEQEPDLRQDDRPARRPARRNAVRATAA